MLAYIPYMDPMGLGSKKTNSMIYKLLVAAMPPGFF